MNNLLQLVSISFIILLKQSSELCLSIPRNVFAGVSIPPTVPHNSAEVEQNPTFAR